MNPTGRQPRLTTGEAGAAIDGPSPPVAELEAEIDSLRAQVAQLTKSGHGLIATQTRLQSLLHRATDAIIQFEADGTISSFNNAAERIFDYPEIEILHQPGNHLFENPPAFDGDMPAYLLHYSQHTLNQYDNPLIGIRRDGARLQLEVSVAQIAGNNLILFDDFSEGDAGDDSAYEAFLCILRDVTERKAIDEELRRHREELEALVDEQVEEVRRARDEAERANRAKSEFLANMSHELRTPMHAILSYSEFGLKKFATARPEKLEQYFNRINTAGTRLLDLIDDLLDLAKAEAGRTVYDMRPVDFRAVLRGVTDECESLLEQRRLHLVVADRLADHGVELDEERIGQVMRNLLSNAIRFSPDGGVIHITLEETRLGDASGDRPAICVRVRDQGPGIPADELEHIFDKFAQSSLNARQSGGTGLGLAIVREVVAAHQGTIAAANNDDVGACFSLCLPRRAAAHPGFGVK